jgi:hypothetical protein
LAFRQVEVQAAVASFVTRVLIALSASLGVAMLDISAQANAAFLAVASSTPPIDVDAGGPDSWRPADLRRDQCAWSKPTGDSPNLWAHTEFGNSSSGGARSSSGPSSGPGPESFASVAVARLGRPILVTRLDRTEAPFVSVLLTAAVFEPPRSGR